MIKTPDGRTVMPGDFAAVRTHGQVSDLISWGERLSGGSGQWQHALFYAGGPDDLILEAEPGGAKLHPFPYANRPHDVLWSTQNSSLDLVGTQRAMAMSIAQKYKGVPYGFLDYLAIALHRAHVPGWLPFWFGDKGRLVTLKTFIAQTGHEICSELVDQCRLDMGSHLFTDDRWAGYVTPDDIGDLILR